MKCGRPCGTRSMLSTSSIERRIADLASRAGTCDVVCVPLLLLVLLPSEPSLRLSTLTPFLDFLSSPFLPPCLPPTTVPPFLHLRLSLRPSLRPSVPPSFPPSLVPLLRPSLPYNLSFIHTQARKHSRTYSRTHARTHAQTHTRMGVSVCERASIRNFYALHPRAYTTQDTKGNEERAYAFVFTFSCLLHATFDKKTTILM